MTVHLRDVNIDTLHNLLSVCRGLPDDERDLWLRMSGVPYVAEDVAMSVLRAPGFHFIVHNGDQPIAAAGFNKRRPGVFRTWMCATPLAWEPYGHDVTRIVRCAIRDIISEGVAHRVETITLADRQRARDWYPKIGLQLETTHRKYGINGEDAVVYVALSGSESG
jgi:hypothetical protein